MTDHDAARGPLSALPSVDALARRAGGGVAATAAARGVLAAARARVAAGSATPDEHALAEEVRARLVPAPGPYGRVVNATGVFLHTGLGRAPLSVAAAGALLSVADGFSLVEVDAVSGERNRREAGLLPDLLALTGGEHATVVNNNAAALLLALRALAAGREVLVSRGQLIEIGGGFRLPEVMALSGARLVEVGSTNKTYAEDYARAVGPATALLLVAHTSNYRVVGHVETPRREALVALAQKHGLPLLEDIGSGLLLPAVAPLPADEPDAHSALAAGVDLVCFSGDKLLGGPQAGVLVGRRELVERCRQDALFRALRPDRLCLAALAATLADHRRHREAVPVLAMLATSPRTRLERARELAARLARAFPGAGVEASLCDGEVGSGSAPARRIGSAAVDVAWPGLPAPELLRRLRTGTPPVWGRLWRDRCRLDVLGLLPGDEERIEQALAALPG